jgi:predicted flap endonuclease-1-like 5' DNA nuclease
MVHSSLILGTGLIIIVIILYIIIRNSSHEKNKVDLKRLYRKSKFKKTNINKIAEKDSKDKLKIIEYESQAQIHGSNISDFKNEHNQPNQENIKKINTEAEKEEENTINHSLDSASYRFTDISVESIHGIGRSYATRLKSSGISTISDLLSATNTSKGLQKTQNETGIYIKVLKKWRKQADLLRIFGIRKNQIDKLAAMKIESTNQLASINPENFHETMLTKYPYSEIPSVGVIKRWVRIAKKLRQIDSTQ